DAVSSLHRHSQVSLSGYRSREGDEVSQNDALERLVPNMTARSPMHDTWQASHRSVEIRESLISAIQGASLTTNERTIMLMRLSKEGAYATRAQLAEMLGTTERSVHYYEQCAIKKIRNHADPELARSIYNFDD